ncbi:cyclin-A2-like isoform X2 [Fundulus heteroclitus]|uniref:cyclin-A2-like isoform X1 n=1 Tax=Fundulus heteroclitus TaxID=8078 RepID=UPI00165C1579|nr:cyclin-A2-like isoform X1 [Fundulus heteroclitus]XP_035983327.1 cyclin-A2-like isoform X2 [Fundulus heteroclitus]
MSAANRPGSAASANHNQENMLTRLRGSLKPRAAANDNQENLPPKQVANRTVLGALQGNQKSKAQNQRGTKQESTQPLSFKNEDLAKSCFERLPARKPAFQIHVDEPEAAPANEVETSQGKPTEEESPLAISNAVAGLRRPLATIDIPAAMDVSFESPMDMSVVEGDEKPINVNEVPEYASEIHTYLREMEVKTRPKAGYMKKQPDITNSMRAILVDWLVEVGEEYKLQNETLYLAVNYIDRFLSSMSVLRGKLQLVGTAAMLLASKFEEIYPPEVAEFVYITDDTYTKKQVLRMEHLVLKVLSFDLAAPTINQFLTQYFCHQAVNKQVESLAMYLGELSLVESDPFLKYLPSQMAAAAYILANNTVTGSSWPKSLVEMTGYTLEDLMPCVEDLHRLHVGAAQHAQQSVREKYKGSKYLEVSCIVAPTKLMLN